MKKIHLLHPLIAAIALGHAPAAETKTSRPELAAPLRQPAKQSAVRTTPIRNYWDANSWDQSGGSLFWHDPSEKRRLAISERNAKRPAASSDRKSGTPADR